MPPQLSDDERSESSEGGVAPSPTAPPTAHTNLAQSAAKSKSKAIEEDVSAGEEGDEEDEEEEDDEDIGEDEYVVEAITDHTIDEDGNLFFEVKWEGFEKKSDRTMEPEENLADSASEVLNEYLAKIGGREALIEAWQEKKAANKKGKKRSRSGTEANGTNGSKRGRKEHPGAGSSSASSKAVEWKPPTGSWEDDVVNIDACEGEEGSVLVYLTWKSGHRTRHPLLQVYKRCPQRMLRFYESHLTFKKVPAEGAEEVEAEE